jgi:hypothetical protein
MFGSREIRGGRSGLLVTGYSSVNLTFSGKREPAKREPSGKREPLTKQLKQLVKREPLSWKYLLVTKQLCIAPIGRWD